MTHPGRPAGEFVGRAQRVDQAVGEVQGQLRTHQPAMLRVDAGERRGCAPTAQLGLDDREVLGRALDHHLHRRLADTLRPVVAENHNGFAGGESRRGGLP